MPLEDRAHIEAYAGLLLGELVANGKDGLSEAGKTYAQWAREDFAWFHRLEKTKPGLSSWNWDIVLAACLLWLDPAFASREASHYTIASWWRDWLTLQVGDRPPLGNALETAYPLTRHFDGSETLSERYGSARYGSVVAVRLLALRHPQHPAAPELARLTKRYMEVLAALLSLSSAPWTDPGYRAANGRMWYTGPTWAPVGERSEPGGLQCAQGQILAKLQGLAHINERATLPAYACIPWLVKLQTEFPPERYNPGKLTFAETLRSLLSDLATVRLWSETHWMHWSDGLLVYSPRRMNSNTPRIFWAWLDDHDRKMTIGYPFPAGRHRGKGASGAQGDCRLEQGASGQIWIVADAIDGGKEASFPLPASGAPLWHIVGDRAGFRMVTA